MGFSLLIDEGSGIIAEKLPSFLIAGTAALCGRQSGLSCRAISLPGSENFARFAICAGYGVLAG